MSTGNGTSKPYGGFEQGPIRPPSEAGSLLIRVTRNCPWNRCTFCPVYKGAKFSRRPVEHVIEDIDAVYRHVEALRKLTGQTGHITAESWAEAARCETPEESQAFAAAFKWMFSGGMKSVFLQDADAVVIKPAALVEILVHLRKRFPAVERVTSYSRARTLASRRESDLRAMRVAGLDRVHVGLESGSDRVLDAVSKGATKERHIAAGLKVKAAGMELSEYVIPGLGGRELSEIHALETADALNRINPDFIRLRTLAIPSSAPLFEEYRAGRFEKCTDLMMAKELLMFIEKLEGITSVIKSDHILNLFGDLEGTLPGDKGRMVGMLRRYLEMPRERQCLYQVGRRIGVFTGIDDMLDAARLGRAESACRELGVTPDNVDEITDELMTRFV